MTPQERRVWLKLRELNAMLGLHFRRKAPVGLFVADFLEFGRRLVIEVDGGQHGGRRDDMRDAWFTGQGFAVLRVWNADVDRNIDGVMQTILDALDAAPPPHPSPTKGEGGHPLSTSTPRDRSGASPPPRGEGMGEGGPDLADGPAP
jgi:very-short-patch-repair endonuclease